MMESPKTDNTPDSNDTEANPEAEAVTVLNTQSQQSTQPLYSIRQHVKALAIRRTPWKYPWKYGKGIYNIFRDALGEPRLFVRIIGFILPIMCILVGAVYFDTNYCPAEPLEILLIFGGIIALLNQIISLIVRQVAKKKRTAGMQIRKGLSGSAKLDFTRRVFRSFSVIWVIVACVYVFRLLPNVQHDDGAPPEVYCDAFLFRFALWITIIALVMIVAIWGIIICMGTFGIIVALRNRNAINNSTTEIE